MQDVLHAVYGIGVRHHGQYLTVSGKIYRDDEYRGQKVEKRAGEKDYQPLPRLLAVVRALILSALALIVVAVKGAESPERKRTQGEKFTRLFVAFLQYRGAETYAEFVYPEPERLPRQIVTELMYHYHDHERDQCQQDIAYICENFTCRGGRQRKDHFISLLWNKCISEPPRLYR